MRRRLVLCCSLAACTALLAACGGSDGHATPTTRTVDQTANETTLTVTPKQSVAIALPANAGTGYHWVVTTRPDPAVARMGPSGYVSPATSGSTTMVGAPGEQRYTIDGVAQGASVFEADYMPPGRGRAPAKRFRVVVKVD